MKYFSFVAPVEILRVSENPSPNPCGVHWDSMWCYPMEKRTRNIAEDSF